MDAGLIEGIVWASVAWLACGVLSIMLAHDRGRGWRRALLWGLALGPLGLWRVARWGRDVDVLDQRQIEEREAVYANRRRQREERARRRRGSA